MQRVLVCGGGAIGSLFACLFAKAGFEVVVLERDRHRLEQLRSRGLECQVEGHLHTFTPLVVESEPPTNARLILLAVKSYATEAVTPDIVPLARHGVPVISLQNGFLGLQQLRQRCASGRFVQAATELGARRTADGIVIQEASGKTYLCGTSEDLCEVAELFAQAGIATLIGPPACLALWKKFALICSVATVCALLGVTVGEVLDNPDALALSSELNEEVCQLARAMGVELQSEEAWSYIEAVAGHARDHIPSLLADVLVGRLTEVDALCGYVSAQSHSLGLRAPTSTLVYRLLKASEGLYHRRIIPATGRKLSLF